MLTKENEGDRGVNNAIPMVAAVNVDHQDAVYHIRPSTVSSTTTPIVAVGNDASDEISGLEPVPAPAMDQGTDCQRAMYFKNPTQEMIEQSYHTSKTSAGILFIQSADNFRGKFTLAKSVTAAHILSGSTIDLSLADFIYPVTNMMVSTIMGGVHVIVPRGVRVQTNGLGIMGSFCGIKAGQNIHAGQDAPLVVLNGFAIMGGVDVCVNENVPPVCVID